MCGMQRVWVEFLGKPGSTRSPVKAKLYSRLARTYALSHWVRARRRYANKVADKVDSQFRRSALQFWTNLTISLLLVVPLLYHVLCALVSLIGSCRSMQLFSSYAVYLICLMLRDDLSCVGRGTQIMVVFCFYRSNVF